MMPTFEGHPSKSMVVQSGTHKTEEFAEFAENEYSILIGQVKV